MLKIECKGNDAIVTAAGSLKVIAVEMGAALASLYEHLYAENPETAGSFREIITKMVVDPSSPVWAPEKKAYKILVCAWREGDFCYGYPRSVGCRCDRRHD